MARLAFPPFLRVFKDNGDVCTDATATWYDAGTTTLVDSYPTAADADANTNPNTNPVAANSLGIFPAMWLEDASEYKIVIAGTGVTTKTVDDVYSTASLDQLSGDRRYLGLAGGAAYTTTGSSNAYVVATGLATTSLNTYETFLIKANFTNTGASTLNVDSIGAKNIYFNGSALNGGEIQSGQVYQVTYDGTQFQLSGGAAVAASFSNANRIINGGMAVNQLVSGSGVADDTYAIDRWYILTQTGTIAWAQDTDQENGAPYAFRLTQSQASAQRIGMATIIEARDVKDLRGSVATLAGRVRCSASTNIRYAVLEWTGTADSVTSDVVADWTSSSYTAGGFFNSTTLNVLAVGVVAATAATNRALDALNATIGSSMNNIIIMVWTESTLAQNGTLAIWNMKFEKGSVATAWVPRPFAVEYAACRRYRQKSFPYATQPAQGVGNQNGALQYRVSSAGAVAAATYLKFEPMRTTPSATFYNPNGANANWRNVNDAGDSGAASVDSAGDSGLLVSNTQIAGDGAGERLAVHWFLDAEL